MLGERRPQTRRLGGPRRLLVADLFQKAGVHEPEVAAAGSPALDHLVAEARAPLPVLGLFGPVGDLGGEPAQRRQALVLAQRRVEHLLGVARDRVRRGLADVAQLGPLRDREHVPLELEERMVAVAGTGEAVEARRLKVLERGVGEVGDLSVVAGQDHGVAGEVRRASVVVQVVEVGQQDRRASAVHRGPRRLPGSLRIGEGVELDRRRGQLHELLLEPADAPVRESRRRRALERHVIEADPRAEPERHLLGDLGAMKGQQVAKRRRAAVVAGNVPVVGDHRRGGSRLHAPGFCLTRERAWVRLPRLAPAVPGTRFGPGRWRASRRSARPGTRGDRPRR